MLFREFCSVNKSSNKTYYVKYLVWKLSLHYPYAILPFSGCLKSIFLQENFVKSMYLATNCVNSFFLAANTKKLSFLHFLFVFSF